MRTGPYVRQVLAAVSLPLLVAAQSAPTATWPLSGKVVIEGRGAPPSPVSIETFCNGVTYASSQTDRKGDFSFRAGPSSNPALLDASVGDMEGSFGRSRATVGSLPTVRASDPASTDTPSDNSAQPVTRRTAAADQLLKNCELRFRLAGYQADPISLANRRPSDGPDLGTILMRPLVKNSGDTVSVASFAIPARARSTFEKGLKAVQNRKPAEARENFAKAVAIYPKYATAWLALGKLELAERRPGEAQTAFEAAIQADSRLAEAHLRLATLQARRGQWRAVAQSSARVIELEPARHPQAYHLNAVANYNIRDVDAAEKSVRQAVDVDKGREYPRSWYLLGKILAEKREYAAAAEQLREYLLMEPHARDAATVRAELARMETLARSSAGR